MASVVEGHEAGPPAAGAGAGSAAASVAKRPSATRPKRSASPAKAACS